MGNGNLFLKFRELDFKHTILEISGGFCLIYTSDIEGTGHLAVATLPTDIVAVIVLLVIVVLPLSRKG